VHRRALILVAALVATPADADDPPGVAIEADCAAVDREVMLRVVRVELGSAIVTGDAADVTRVTAICEPDRVHLRVDDPITGKALERSIELGEVDATVGARLLGLAIVELVAASWIELELRPAPPPEREEAVVAAVRRRMPAPRRPPVEKAAISLAASVGERRHEHQLTMRAAEIRASYRLGWLSLGVDGGAGAGERPVTAGSIDVLLWTVGAHAAAQLDLDRLRLETGIGASAGSARLRGRSEIGADEMSFTAPVATLHGRLGASAHASERWFLHITVEAGIVLAGADAVVPEHTEPVYRGTFLGLATGIGVAF
jgi:hypothetical protein